MEGHGRRFRRQIRGRAQTLLPLRSTPLSNTLSCWYCDLKISSFNQPLYLFGQKHARFLRAWFTVGNGFSISVLFGVTLVRAIDGQSTCDLCACYFVCPNASKEAPTQEKLLGGPGSMILIWQLVAAFCLSCGGNTLSDVISSLLTGIKPSLCMSLGMQLRLQGISCMRSSEGVQLEYIAIFLAVLFPGALVAFNYELLQAKPRSSALRIYCAGIWHNAVCCAVCGLALLLLPSILFPLYIHSENPTVLDISASSPVSGYLSPGDVIESLGGTKIRNQVDWMEKAISLEKQSLTSSEAMNGYLTIDKRRIYCAPISLVQKSEYMSLTTNQSTCPDEHIAFVSIPCFDLGEHVDGIGEYDVQKIRDDVHCLAYADIVKINNCGSLGRTTDAKSNCICSENELCLSPVQMPGVAWAEIAYRSPYSDQCIKLENNLTESSESSGSGENCHKTFLYVGDVRSMARSVRLMSYQPRYTFTFGSYLPYMLEKFFVCTFQVSMALALLNCLPVYFLDGEAILEGIFFYITYLNPRTRRFLLQACLFGGSLISCLVFLQIFL